MKEKGFYLQQESGEFVFLTEGDLHKASDYYYIYKLTEYLLNSSTTDNPSALTSEILEFISKQDDFYDDAAYANAEAEAV